MCSGSSGNQRLTLGATLKKTMLFFETCSLIGLEFTNSAWLAGQEAPGIHLSPSPPPCWDSKLVSPHLTINIYTYIHTCVYAYVYKDACMCIYVYVYICIYVVLILSVWEWVWGKGMVYACKYRCLQRPEVSGAPGARVTDDYVLPNVGSVLCKSCTDS